MQTKVIYYWCIIGFLVAGCETIVDIDIPKEAPKLVVNSLISPDSLVKIRLIQSRHILDKNDSEPIPVNGAMVVLKENGVAIEEIYESETEGYYTGQTIPKSGNIYSLEIKKNGFENIITETEIPMIVPIEQLQIDSVLSFTSKICIGDSCIDYKIFSYKVTISFTDPDNQENYYAIRVISKIKEYFDYNDENGNPITDTIDYENPENLYSEDPAITNLEFDFEGEGIRGHQLLFTDELFNNKKYTLNFDIDNYFYGDPSGAQRNEVQFTFLLIHLSEDYYQYFRTKELQVQNDGNPFAEPVLVYNNIRNGFGIFAGFNQDKRVITIKK